MSNPTRNVILTAIETDWLQKASGVDYADCLSDTPDAQGFFSGYDSFRVGQRYYETKGGAILHWRIARGFVAFDAGPLDLASEIIEAATLRLAPKSIPDSNFTDFNFKAYAKNNSDSWGPGLGSSDWSALSELQQTINTSAMTEDTYSEWTIATDIPSLTGRTEFRLLSAEDQAELDPDNGDPSYEDIDVWGRTGTYRPQLVLGLRITKREAILLNLVSTIQGIDGTGDWNEDFSGTGRGKQVHRGFMEPDEVGEYPTACIIAGRAAYQVLQTSPLKLTAGTPQGADGWPISVLVYFKISKDLTRAGALEKKADQIEADIKTAVLTDQFRGNSDFVMGTYHRETSPVENTGDGRGAINITFAVKYDTPVTLL